MSRRSMVFWALGAPWLFAYGFWSLVAPDLIAGMVR